MGALVPRVTETLLMEDLPPETLDYVSELEKDNAKLRADIIKLTNERDAARKDAKSWKSEFEMYANAWQRELGNRLFNKRHLIDALVKTTKHLQVNFTEWERHTKAIKEYFKLVEVAYTIGVPITSATVPLPDLTPAKEQEPY